ncbi:MAG: hypothetical protein JRE61_14505 [Deltaproteobacteria bacterium]|jgi:hypothetical protein|nr:hypothetical protein [Deltaproteobacteria bacterium]
MEKSSVADNKLLIHISDRDKLGSVLSLATRLMDDSKGKDLEIHLDLAIDAMTNLNSN